MNAQHLLVEQGVSQRRLCVRIFRHWAQEDFNFLTLSINFTVDDRRWSMARSLQAEGGQISHAQRIGPVLPREFYGFGLLPFSLDDNQSF
jgi:hypothetical protein